VTHLWAVLDAQERSLSWLARRMGYTQQYLSLLKTGRRAQVSERFATAASAVLNLPIEDLFLPVESPVSDEKTLAGVAAD
jgi:transcriptional regulator with XRE-family HTH domain